MVFIFWDGYEISMGMSRKCVYKNCTNSKRHNPGLSFFSFPSKVEQRDIWIRNSGNVNLFHKIGRRGVAIHGAWAICEQHFKPIYIRAEYTVKHTVKKTLQAVVQAVPYKNRKALVKHAVPFVYGKEVESDSEDEFHVNLTTNLRTYPKYLNKRISIKQEVKIDDTELGLADAANTTDTTVHHSRIGGEQVNTKHWDMCGSTSQNPEQTSVENDKAKNGFLLDKIKTEVMDGEELDVTDASQGLIGQESNISTDTTIVPNLSFL